MEQLWAILPVVIGGVFTIIGALLSRQSTHVRVEVVDGKLMQAAAVPNATAPPLQPATIGGAIRWGSVALDIGIILLLTGIGGFLVGLASGDRPMEEMMPVLGLSNLVLATVGFTISGARNAGRRWLHLLLVAVGVWLSSSVNLLMGLDLASWLLAAIFVAVTMAVGGALSYLFARRRT